MFWRENSKNPFFIHFFSFCFFARFFLEAETENKKHRRTPHAARGHHERSQ